MADNKFLEKLNGAVDKIVNTLGIGKDKEEVYDEEELRGQVEGFIENKNENATEQQVQMSTDQFMRRIEDVVDEAIHTGREQERMKGEDSDQLYNMVVLGMFSSVISVAILVYVHFM